VSLDGAVSFEKARDEVKQRIRIATTVGALGAAVVLLLPLATGAGAAALTFGFGFKTFVLPKILDIGIPHASNELNTSAGASAMSEAAQAYPGDVLIGALHHPEDPEGLPGGFPAYSVSKYPPGQSETRNVTGSLFGQETGFPTAVGPLGIDTGHLETNARERQASSSTTTKRLIFGEDVAAPLLTIGSVKTSTSAIAEASRVRQIARTAVKDIVITPSADLIITIGGLVSEAITESDGATSDATATLTLTNVTVRSGGTEYAATIDSKGVHITGAPEDAPNSIDVDLAQSIANATKGLQNSGVTIRTADAVRVVEGASSEASIGGLIIGLEGEIPRVPVAQNLINEVLAPITDQIETYCPAQDERIPPPFDEIAKALPVCVSPQLVPTGGTGTITSLAIGSVDSVSAASTGFVPSPVGGGDGGFAPGPVGDLGPGLPPADFGNGNVPPPGQPTQTGTPRLFGLVARMPAGALLAGGLTFLVIAVAMTIGPSLRRWRAAT
jgi:hypothetical protein